MFRDEGQAQTILDVAACARIQSYLAMGNSGLSRKRCFIRSVPRDCSLRRGKACPWPDILWVQCVVRFRNVALRAEACVVLNLDGGTEAAAGTFQTLGDRQPPLTRFLGLLTKSSEYICYVEL